MSRGNVVKRRRQLAAGLWWRAGGGAVTIVSAVPGAAATVGRCLAWWTKRCRGGRGFLPGTKRTTCDAGAILRWRVRPGARRAAAYWRCYARLNSNQYASPSPHFNDSRFVYRLWLFPLTYSCKTF